MVLNEGNQSSVSMFILLGFSGYPRLQAPLFLVFLTIYTVTLVGNLGIIVVIRTSPKLHTPIFFSQPSILFGYLLFQHIYTQTPRYLGSGRQNFLFQMMHGTVFLWLCICDYGDVHASSDGL